MAKYNQEHREMLLLSNQKRKKIGKPAKGMPTKKTQTNANKGLLSNHKRESLTNQPKEGQQTRKDPDKR